MKLVSAHDLDRSEGPGCVFDRVSISIDGGDQVGLISPSDSARTTFLRMIVGQVEAGAGTTLLGLDAEIAHADPRRALEELAQRLLPPKAPLLLVKRGLPVALHSEDDRLTRRSMSRARPQSLEEALTFASWRLGGRPSERTG